MTDKIAGDTACQAFPKWGVQSCTIAKLGRGISDRLRDFDDFCCAVQPPSVEEELRKKLPECIDLELEVQVKKDFPDCDWSAERLQELREECVRRLVGEDSEPTPTPQS